jgi:phosphate butyryltransferase
MINSFQNILETVKYTSGKKTISVSMANSVSVLKAIAQVEERNIANALLVGETDKIKEAAKQINFNVKDENIIHAETPEEIAQKSVSLIVEGRADILMKGNISTPILMKAVLNKENGLRNGGVLSHVAVVEVPTYPKLLTFSDGGINIAPDMQTKESILLNMLKVTQKFKIDIPKVGILCPIEKVNPKIQATLDAAELQNRAENGEFGDVIVEGPIAMDVILSKKAAEKKGLVSKVAGDTDAVLVPEITTGNGIIKSLIYLANAKVGGVVVGAKVPIILLSRSDKPEEKINSILLSVLIG